MGCKEIEVRKFEFVAKAPFFLLKMLSIISENLSNDTAVVCRWLGFAGGQPTVNSYFCGESKYAMANVECTGELCW